MNKNRPWYRWHPDSLGFLERKHENGEHISADDLARVVENNPEAASGPLINSYLVRALRGELTPASGRPSRSLGRDARIVVAGYLAREQMEEWRAARARGEPDAPARVRGGPSISALAYEKVAREMRLGMSGRGLANAVSSLKDWPYLGD